jgi:hypothetical protein
LTSIGMAWFERAGGSREAVERELDKYRSGRDE